MNHELQHAESPTWCIHCGRFDFSCKDVNECTTERTGRFDSRAPENFQRMFCETFGQFPEVTRA